MNPSQARPLRHGFVFLLCWAATAVGFERLNWPIYLVIPLALYAFLVLALTPLRQSQIPVRAGRLDRPGVLAAFALTAATSTVLLLHQHWMMPDVSLLAQMVPVRLFGSVLLACLAFSILNAALEELLLRWVLYDVIAAEWGHALAIAATSILFGCAHLHGYPPGLLGAMLAGLYGVGLGLLRWWSGGLALPWICHITADATIFWILADSSALAAE